jgi:hypothetical protein
MNTPKWGRKETIIFPPHSPIYTYGAVFFTLILTGMFVYTPVASKVTRTLIFRF